MSGKQARAARKQAEASAPPTRPRRPTNAGFWTTRRGIAVILGVVAVLVASFVLPGVLGKKATSSEVAHAMSMGVAAGAGMPAGTVVPSFSGTNILDGTTISDKSVFGHKTLLFFSEGVMCQACFQQIQGLQEVGAQLYKRGIQLVSITPDSTGDLRQAAQEYSISTPLISDSSRKLSAAFNTLGKGMHSDTPGHAFALIYHGKVLWYRDYWLPPYSTMYVQPTKLLAAIPSA